MQPLVSIVTPVYNGESHIADCIKSVLGQTYRHWEYLIVNNSSTDRTLEIVELYRQKDSRIRIENTSELLPVVENHNFAFSLISPDSGYCKILHAADMLFPECLEQMVNLAVSNPTVGIVGSYSLGGSRVRCDGLPYPTTVVPGRELGRLTLLGKTYPFWSPTSTMIRSDLIHSRAPFYEPIGLHGDVAAMYEVLQQCDFGFAHQILTYHREHSGSVTAKESKPMNTLLLSNVDLLVRYGSIYLTKQELTGILHQRLNKYYRFLANSFWEGRNREFWQFHRGGLESVGQALSYMRLIGAIVRAAICDSRATARRIRHRLGRK